MDRLDRLRCRLSELENEHRRLTNRLMELDLENQKLKEEIELQSQFKEPDKDDKSHP